MIDTFITTVMRRARAVLITSLVILVAAAALGVGAISRLQSGGFDDPSAESAQAATALAEKLGRPTANFLLLVTAPSGATVDDAVVADVGRAAVSRLDAEPGVEAVADFWSAPAGAAAALRGSGGRTALVVAHIDGDEDDYRERIATLQPAYTTTSPEGVTVQTGGAAQTVTDITLQVKKDFALAEALAIPATLLLLVVVFGAFIAGLLPMLVGAYAMVGTLAVLRILTAVTDVSIFSLNLPTALGLGLGIDYALLVVNRFREELQSGADVEGALRATMHTAGRTVAYSAITVAVALGALLAFPMYFLRSFAYAGIAVTLLTAGVSLVVLPAALRLLGHRAAYRRFGQPTRYAAAGLWSRVATVVMRRPVLTAAPVVVLLGVLAAPLAGVSFGLPDDRSIPVSHSQGRAVAEVLRSDFTSRESEAVTVVFPDGAPERTDRPTLAAYGASLSVLPSVSRVDTPVGTYVRGARVSGPRPDLLSDSAAAVLVIPDVEVYSQAAQDLVTAIRRAGAPAAPLVGGPTARFVDVNASIASRLPLVGALIALTTFLVIFFFTGSIVLPVKALLTNAATIAAVLGVMVWVFQEGHGSGLLGFTPTPLSVSIPPLMFCLAFGLSMDYEVFLLGRIKEARDRGLDDTAAVASGLGSTGRIVTAAAALMSVTFLAFSTSKVSFIQMLGLGCALAILLDATLVRGVLVPALMRLIGRWNWWAPAPLVRLHERIAPAPEGFPRPLGLARTGTDASRRNAGDARGEHHPNTAGEAMSGTVR